MRHLWFLLLLPWIECVVVDVKTAIMKGVLQNLLLHTGGYKEVVKPLDGKENGVINDKPNEHYTILKILGQSDNIDGVIKYSQEVGLFEIGQSPEAQEHLLHLLAQAGESKFLWNVFLTSRQEGITVSLKAYIICVDHFIQTDELHRLWSVFLDMKAAETKAHYSTYFSMLRSFAESKMPNEAWAVFLEINEWKIHYDHEACKVLLDALVLAGQNEELCRLTSMVASRIDRTVYLTMAIDSYALAGKIGDAYDIFVSMGRANTNQRKLNYATKYTNWATLKDDKLALPVFGLFSRTDVEAERLKKPRSEQLYNLMIHHLLEFDSEFQLADIYDLMKLDGINLDSTAFNGLLNALEQLNIADGAWKVFDDIKRANIEVHKKILISLMQIFTSKGWTIIAWEAFKYMLQHGLAEGVKAFNIPADTESMSADEQQREIAHINYLLNTFETSNLPDAASRVFYEMKQANYKGFHGTYTLLVQIFASQQWTKSAWQVFRYMQEKNISADVKTYWILVETLLREGETFKVLEVFACMQARGLINLLPDGTYINHFSKADVEERVIQIMAQAGYKPDKVTNNDPQGIELPECII